MIKGVVSTTGAFAALVFSMVLSACSGTQSGVLPSTAVSSAHGAKPQFYNVSPCLGGCYNYSNDANLGYGNVGSNPGPSMRLQTCSDLG